MEQVTLYINGRFLTQPVTGVQRVGIEFCHALDDLLSGGEFTNLSVEILVPRGGSLITDLDLRRITLRRVGRMRGHLWEQIQLPWHARESRLLALGNTAPLTTLLLAPKKTYVMVHDLSYRYFPDAYNLSFRLLYSLVVPAVVRRAAVVFTVSESERSAILVEYPNLSHPERIVAVQNGSAAPCSSVVPREDRGRNCLYVGSLTRRKNAAGLIEAAIELVRSHGVTFTFVGSNGPSFEGVDVEIPEDVAAKMRFLGQVNDPIRLSAEYLNAAVFLFPSFYEASPLPPIEAMSHGCPVVASGIPSLRERCGDAAIYCDPNDVTSIVDSVARLLESEQLWSEMHRRGVSRSATYSWSAQTRRIVEEVLSQ